MRLAPCLARLSAAGLALACAAASPARAAPTNAAATTLPALSDAYDDLYSGYRPDFIGLIEQESGYGGLFRNWKRSEEEMRLSTERSFHTLNRVDEDARANALVEAALQKEAQHQHREALKMYQMVIEKFPHVLYRVSQHGIFVPAAQYCQRRILRFPAADLAFYRSLYDARARESYEQARRQYSLIGLSEIADTMLATSYGGRATLELGNAALDMGHYLAALEYFTTVRDYFPDRDLKTPELGLKIAQCEKLLGSRASPPLAAMGRSELAGAHLERLRGLLAGAPPSRPPFASQLASAPHVAADDYLLMPPSTDPLGLNPPVWSLAMPASRRDFFVFTQPVVTDNSVVYRHKNIVYCRSILNGEPRWVNDMGGRAVWQNFFERQYPQEDLLVQDGLVIATVSKVGPSLVALDEVTGQLKWAYGPMVAANEEEARMRFEAAPAGGPRTVYASYVLDNIEGEAHTDTEYGVVALESATGRMLWRTPLCRLAPGKFSAGFAEVRRNKVRSFTSPPLYHEGTVYYNSNAGAVAAIDGQSGRVKWLERYPYWPGIHDATRMFGAEIRLNVYFPIPFPHSPMFWYNQRPLLIDERLYVLPVDSKILLCIDRRGGKVLWSKPKGLDAGEHGDTGGCAYMLGPTRQGHLVLVYSRRQSPVQLVNPADGQTVWKSPDLIMPDNKPVMKYDPHTYTWAGIVINRRGFTTAGRPFLDVDDNLDVGSFAMVNTGSYGGTIGWCYHLTRLSLSQRQILAQRRYYSGEVPTIANHYITTICPNTLKNLEALPAKDKTTMQQIGELKEIVADTVPQNEHGPFMPFSRVTFSRHGVPFELRIGPREMAMVYDRAAVQDAVAARSDPAAVFARAELAVAAGRYDEAAGLLKSCLASVSSEDLDFRAAINQQLYGVHRRLAQSAIRTVKPAAELEHALGMSRTAGTLAEEIETLFALSEAYARRNDLANAARCLRTVIERYGRHDYPLAAQAVLAEEQVLGTAAAALDRTAALAGSGLYGREFSGGLGLLKQSLPLYLSTVSPLPKTLTLRAGELAAARLLRLARGRAEFARQFEAAAVQALGAQDEAERLQRLWEFPGTAAGQRTLEELAAGAGKLEAVAGRQRLWRLADAARVCGLQLPAAARTALAGTPEPEGRRVATVTLPQQARTLDFEDPDGAIRLVLPRRDDGQRHDRQLFIGGRVREKLDNKFTLTSLDLEKGERLWETERLRLKGKGQEAGFAEAFVVGDRVVVHGLYDVLAFSVRDGKQLWSYRVPFDFEIKETVLSGDLLLLAGKTETVALYVPTENPMGEVAWQVAEMGDLYIPPYLRGERLVSVRKMPFGVTVRYRATGQLISRLELPDLSLLDEHPLLDNGPPALPAAHCANLLAVTDGRYYLMVDTDRPAILWKRLIDANDPTREPAMRLALSERYLSVLKKDYTENAIYLLAAASGAVLWRSDQKVSGTPAPMDSVIFAGERMYGVIPHAGQGYYLAGLECGSGKLLFRQEETGYKARPNVTLLGRLEGETPAVVALVESNRTDFEINVFDALKGEKRHTVRAKGTRDEGQPAFGVPGRVSAAVQHGRVVLLSRDELQL